MKHTHSPIRSALVIPCLFILLLLPIGVNAAVLYKSYVVQKDRGIDILCDPYVVQKNDYIWKLFREKGEISTKDFPDFISIFGRLNPHIQDMDRILPGQRILIPLKKLAANAYPNQETGLVTIPFMTLVDTSELLKTHSNAHTVKSGETVSVLIARQFGNYGSRSYNAGIKLFQFLNPDVKDLDRIYTGQELNLPDASIQEESWYASLLDEASGIANQADLDKKIYGGKVEKESASDTARTSSEGGPSSGLKEAAKLMGAELMNKGRYFQPNGEGKEMELDLDRFPMMELKDGSRIIFPDKTEINEEALNTLSSNWPGATIVPVSPDDSYEHILDTVFQLGEKKGIKDSLSISDNGINIRVQARWILDEPETDFYPERHICVTPVANPEERTPNVIVQYLGTKNVIIKETLGDTIKGPLVENDVPDAPADMFDEIAPSDQPKLVAKCLEILGYPYSQRSTITFPYAGIQIKAIANIILRTNNIPLLVDFGDFHGDAITALKKTGFDIVQINATDDADTVLKKILDALEVPFKKNPVFLGAQRSQEYNIFLTIPGVYLTGVNQSKLLFCYTALPAAVRHFLTAQNINVVQIKEDSSKHQIDQEQI